MQQKLFTVYDEKAESYLPPFFVPTTGLATRAFTDCVNSADHQFGKHPHDYTLFYLGEFDQDKASFSLVSAKSLGNGVEYLNPDHISAKEEYENVKDDTPILTDETSGNPS